LSMRWWWGPFCTRPTLFFIVLVHWHNSPLIYMSPHSDTLSWFRAKQSLLFLFNAALLVEKQPIPILLSFGLTRSGLEPTIYRIRSEHTNYYTTDVVIQ